ncbi:MAG: hypothetical protein JWO98_1176 [Frankiales bacterium]|nr:hypothetical protein [Frankiales bacterium]
MAQRLVDHHHVQNGPDPLGLLQGFPQGGPRPVRVVQSDDDPAARVHDHHVAGRVGHAMQRNGPEEGAADRSTSPAADHEQVRHPRVADEMLRRPTGRDDDIEREGGYPRYPSDCSLTAGFLDHRAGTGSGIGPDRVHPTNVGQVGVRPYSSTG